MSVGSRVWTSGLVSHRRRSGDPWGRKTGVEVRIDVINSPRRPYSDRLESIKNRRGQIMPNDVLWLIREVESLRSRLELTNERLRLAHDGLRRHRD